MDMHGYIRRDEVQLSISLKNSMKLGKFSECEVVAGHEGIDRTIENITIMEVPDIVKWLKKKELILTSLFAIKDDIDAQNVLVQRLYYAGATALAIKPFESIKEIPPVMIDNANKLGFPIIKIPNHVRYLDILSPVMHHIFDKKVTLQEDIDQATNILQEISLHSQGLEAFVENVSTITQNIVTIESEWTFIQTPEHDDTISPLTEDEKHELSILKRPIRYMRKYGDALVSCIVAPIIVDKEYFGNITCWAVKQNHIAMDIAVLEKASSLISLEFLRLKVRYDMEQQYRSDFMRELLFNKSMTEMDLTELGKRYHIDNKSNYVCFFVDTIKGPNVDLDFMQWKEELTVAIQELWPNILIGMIRGKICIIHQLNGQDNAQAVAEKIYNIIHSILKDVESLYMGVGGVYDGFSGIRKSFYQAEQAIKLIEMNKSLEPIIYFEKLGMYRLLEPLIGTQTLSDFYDNSIGKLVNADSKGELILTLQTYFNENEVLNTSADKLFIHVNTLKYRMKRIEEITGLDLRQSEDKLTLFLGLKIYEFSV